MERSIKGIIEEAKAATKVQLTWQVRNRWNLSLKSINLNVFGVREVVALILVSC